MKYSRYVARGEAVDVVTQGRGGVGLVAAICLVAVTLNHFHAERTRLEVCEMNKRWT